MEHLTIDRAHDGFLNNDFTCRELVTYYLDRIRELNGPLPPWHVDSKSQAVSPVEDDGTHLNAIISVSETALQEADELDDYWFRWNRWKGVLHGIPVIVKDCIATAGQRTTFGSSRAASYVSEQDATVIQNLKREGAIIIAKSTLPDWSASLFCLSSLSGATGNPFDLARDPSSGTGAAIAADLAILGLDTDTDGTIGLCASSCSLVGLRPRPGMISRHGISPLVSPQDTPGPICRTVRDAALMYGAMVGFDAHDPLTCYSTVMPRNARKPAEFFAVGLDAAAADPSTLRIGLLNSLFGDDEQTEHYLVNQPVREALDILADAGATIVPVTVPHLQQWLTTTQLHIYRTQSDLNKFFTSKTEPPLDLTVASLAQDHAHHPTQDLFDRIASGAQPDRDPPYHICLEKHGQFGPLVMSKMCEFDVDFLAFPTSQVPAPLIADILSHKWNFRNFPNNANLAAQTVLPSISIPVGHTDDYIPIGLTLVASIFHEKDLLEAAAAVEMAVDARILPAF